MPPDRGPTLLRPLVCALAAAAVLAGCTSQPQPDAGRPTTGATPSPTPTTAATVQGAAHVVVVTADPSSLVFNDRATPEPDQAAIDALAARVQAWLDTHLTGLQDGGDGALDEVAAPGLLDGADPALLASVTSDLASPSVPVAHAVYHLVVAHSGHPLWLRAHVTTVDRDGTEHLAGFVFTPGDAGQPQLVAAGPGPLTAGS